MSAPLADPTLAALHDIDRAEDGWPTSVALGLAQATSRFLDLVVPTLTRAGDEVAHELAWVFLANATEDTVDAVLQHVATHASLASRERLAAAVKRDLAAQEKSRQQMLSLGVQMPAIESSASRWARYAGQLGVAP